MKNENVSSVQKLKLLKLLKYKAFSVFLQSLFLTSHGVYLVFNV